MAERVVLHVGVPKTGTTFLQQTLLSSRDRLAGAGVLVAGRSLFEQHLVSAAVRNRPVKRAAEAWDAMLDQIRQWPGTAIVTDEWLGAASRPQAKAVLDALAPAETHVVCTARDFVALVPAAWQELLKLGRARSLGEFVAGLEVKQRWSWSALDPALVLDRWAGGLSRERVHLVTVQPSRADPQLLWDRFAAACGLDPAWATVDSTPGNASLSVEAARLLQLAGPRLREAVGAEDGSWNPPYRWIRQSLAHDILLPRPGTRIRLDDDHLGMLRKRSQSTAAALAAAGYQVHGDLDDLTGVAAPADARRPDDVTEGELLELALDVVAELLGRLRATTLRAESAERRLAQASPGEVEGEDRGSR